MSLYPLYTALAALAALLALPLLPLVALHPRWRAGLLQRLGWLPAEVRGAATVHEGSLWVHAASLGEVNAVAPVVRELLPRLPRLNLVFTCTSSAGVEQARRLFPQAGACLYLAADLPWLLRPWMRRFKPRLALVAETELWPNFLRALTEHGCQTMLVNGRLTERSARRYRLFRLFFGQVLEHVELFGMQADADAGRLAGLGARPTRISVTGNTKFDVGAPEELHAQAGGLRAGLAWPRSARVIVAGSTRPGEEALLLEAYLALRRSVGELRLVLAPRHLERVEDAAQALKGAKIAFSRRSAAGPAPEALLLDTLGELRAAYALAADGGLAWVGGSFRDFGGQNPLEPAALGVPVLFGPFMRHFAEASQALTEAGAAIACEPGQLAAESARLLGDPARYRAMAGAGQACMQARSGASKRSADLAWKLLLVSRMKRDGHAWRDEGLSQLRSVTEFGSAVDGDA
jgi:3-deoxy-D-manno-octulosonic-acid transferase